MSRPHVLELSQPGRSSAVAVNWRPGRAAGDITTRLYGPPVTSPGVQDTWPRPLLVQKSLRFGGVAGAVRPRLKFVATGRAPVPMSTVRITENGTPLR
ncbi:hypothetical protein [Actinoplanes sp. NPDC048796]|uniref:hypothetical protein n=1 Tax=unclassified Actinoplanes TaxID=2626549 RepID=UPI0033D6C549